LQKYSLCGMQVSAFRIRKSLHEMHTEKRISFFISIIHVYIPLPKYLGVNK